MTRTGSVESSEFFRGKIVAITGGARGIGEATARQMAAAGARIAIGDLDPEAAGSTAATLGDGHLGTGLDVTDGDSFEQFIDQVENELGPIDILINNAGVMLLGPLEELSEEAITTMLEINLNGVITGSRLALKRMKPRNRGLIINVASQAGKIGLVGGSIYCATKFGVVGLTESMRRELHGTGVGVSCVMPSPVNTRMGRGLPNAVGIPTLTAEEVATAIVRGAIRHQPEVWVPQRSRAIYRLGVILPISLLDRMGRLLRLDRVLTKADPVSRAEYERDVSRD